MMRLSMVLFAGGLLGVIGGAFLIGQWAVGVAIVADSVVVAGFGLMRDVPEKPELSSVRRRAA